MQYATWHHSYRTRRSNFAELGILSCRFWFFVCHDIYMHTSYIHTFTHTYIHISAHAHASVYCTTHMSRVKRWNKCWSLLYGGSLNGPASWTRFSKRSRLVPCTSLHINLLPACVIRDTQFLWMHATISWSAKYRRACISSTCRGYQMYVEKSQVYHQTETKRECTRNHQSAEQHSTVC